MTRVAKLPAEPKPEDLLAIVDSREQLELDLSPLRVEHETLDVGDYSLKGLQSIVTVERKSLADLVMCCGRERERFTRELHKLAAFPHKCLVIESTWDAIETGAWRSQLRPAHVTGSLTAWMAQGIPIHLAGDHDRAGRFVARFLFQVARRRWREARSLLNGALAQPNDKEAFCDG